MNEQQVRVDYSQTTGLKCDECGQEIFSQGFKIQKLSALLSPTGKVAYAPIPVFYCLNCKHINEEFLPKEENQ